jgi:replication factor C small subunit
MVLLLADYQYKSAFVVDQEINFVAFLTEVMVDCELK